MRYDLTIKYRDRRKNDIADTLSRMDEPESKTEQGEGGIFNVKLSPTVILAGVDTVATSNFELKQEWVDE